jgi:hypothetical protein
MVNSTLDAKFGVIEVGILISTFLYGITTVQTYVYFRASRHDPLWLKTLVKNLGHRTFIALMSFRWLLYGEAHIATSHKELA